MILGVKMPTKLAEKVRRIALIIPVDLIKRVDQWRARQPDVPNLSAAIRRLLEMGMASDAKGKKPKGDHQ